MGSAVPTTTHHLLPPFPSHLPTAPLVSISLSKLEAGDEAESKAFYEASKNLGFFYLQLSEDSELGQSLIKGAERLHVRILLRKPVPSPSHRPSHFHHCAHSSHRPRATLETPRHMLTLLPITSRKSSKISSIDRRRRSKNMHARSSTHSLGTGSSSSSQRTRMVRPGRTSRIM